MYVFGDITLQLFLQSLSRDCLQMASSDPDADASSTETPISPIRTGCKDPSESQSSSKEHLPLAYENKAAYYNSASEKSISHAEAKMIYRRHILEASDHDCQKPIKRMRTSPSIGDSADNRNAANRSIGGHLVLKQQVKRLSQQLDPAGYPFASHLSGSSATIDPGSDLNSSALEAEAGVDPVSETLPDNSTANSADISPELSEISAKIQRVLKLRHQFIQLSSQGSSDNPKDQDGWQVYPPPPNPIWDENKSRPRNTVMRNRTDPPTKPLTQFADRVRKQGQDIGEDFDMDELKPLPGKDEGTEFELDGTSIYTVYDDRLYRERTPVVAVPSLGDYYRAMDEIQSVSSDGPTKSFAYRQLDILEGKFQLYFLVNSYQETADCKKVPHRDFYNVRKVDTHVHHSACMNQKHLLRFIKSKMKRSPDEVVMFRDGQELTLQQVFDSIHLSAYDLSIDTLDMHASASAHTDSFHRFDKFNLKYNPIGESRLREIFLKTDNYINGRYLAELTKEVISDLESSKYQFVEWRVSVYGRSISEWSKLAAWVIDNKLISHNVRWLIQIPRLYSMYKATGQMETFESIIVNIFEPLYRVTQDPSSDPKLHVFLQRVVGFDSVDDESKIETRLYRKFPPPKEWDTKQNPPYTYWIYYLFANMTSLNAWRKRRGFNTFVLRPHCGEAGDIDHLAAAVLCCHSISHGLMLRKVPLLQYIFYLDQIGIAMSPLSNNALFLSYDRNPFPKYLKRGLNVSLSTDDPLQFAFTKEPLIEEYSVAAQIYRLSAVDMCELAQHSVMQSGFEHELKKRWLGDCYHLPGLKGNSVAKSNVPDIREQFRYNTLTQELDMIERFAAAAVPLSPVSMIQPSVAPTTTPLANGKSPVARGHAAHISSSSSKVDLSFSAELQPGQLGDSGLARTSSTVCSPSSSQGAYGITESPTVSHPRIFPGIVHERHRRRSIRQGSGSETDGDSMRTSGTLTDRRLAPSSEFNEGHLDPPVLEEAVEDA